jgi:glycosyltransferase involved in cell wall biosynthesis
LASTLLIDIGPAVGGHGQRGIGRYVRGLAASITTFPDDLVDRIWALGFQSPTLDAFGARAVTFTAHRGFGWIPTWATGRLATDGALKKSGARVLHATDPQRPWTHSAVPSIVTVYDLIPLRERETRQSWRLDHQLVYRWYIRQVESAARILTISRTTAEDLQERLGIAPERIDIVYPMVASPVRVHRTEPPEPTFLFVGALDPHKQPELALRAFGHFHSRFGLGRLRYIGPSDHPQERRLRDLATQLGVAGSISIEGRISDRDLEKAYGGATALVSTSRIEGFGLPSVEAVLRGVPVIAVENPAAKEALEGVAAIVAADVEAIAEAMAHPVNPLEQAVAEIRERYSIASVARSLADIYRRTLA